MIALTRMRLAGFLRGGRAVAPLITLLVIFSILHGGGPSLAMHAYAYSAVCLFPVLAWLTKLLLDTEPDAQRRLARLAVGPLREGAGGLLAAVFLAAVVCLVAMLVPWPLGAIAPPRPDSAEPSTQTGILLGILAHVLSMAAAVTLGALSGRAVTRRLLPGVVVLVSGSILVIVLGLTGSIAPWLVPPVMATAREMGGDHPPDAATLLVLVVWTVLWCAAALAGYAGLRRARS